MKTAARSLAVLGLLAGGCAQDEFAPDFEVNSGRAPGAAAYAPGPYGVGVGSTIHNLNFVGFGNPVETFDTDDVANLQLADFYNPSGYEMDYEDDGGLVLPAESYGEDVEKPLALMIITSAEWCGPCIAEGSIIPGVTGSGILVTNHEEYRPLGGEFLLALQQDIYGDPADVSAIQRWIDDPYDAQRDGEASIDYPAALDPQQKIFQYTGRGAFPGMVMLRTTDMKIVAIRVGALSPGAFGAAEFWDTFEAVLAGDPVLPEDYD